MNRWRGISRGPGPGQFRIVKVLVRELGQPEPRECKWSDEMNFDVWVKGDVEARGKVAAELWIECTSQPLFEAVLVELTFCHAETGDQTMQVLPMERVLGVLN